MNIEEKWETLLMAKESSNFLTGMPPDAPKFT